MRIDSLAVGAGVAVLITTLLAAGCQSTSATSKAVATAPSTAVEVIEVAAEDVPLYTEYTAQTFARDLVEVRGRVDGYIEKRLFDVGSDVKAGEVLYTLDLRPYEADVAKAKG